MFPYVLAPAISAGFSYMLAPAISGGFSYVLAQAISAGFSYVQAPAISAVFSYVLAPSMSSKFLICIGSSNFCWVEKLTNANRSVSSVNDRLFPVELTETADWKSMSEYMLHSNFGKALTGVIGGNFGAYTCFLNICLSFWMFYRRKEYFNKMKILRNFRE